MNRTRQVYVRFDSLATGAESRSFVFEGLIEDAAAREPAEVAPLLRRVEQAVSEGLHAAGYLAYEAGPGLDPALATRPPDTADGPLAWFGIFRDRRVIPPLAELIADGGYRLRELRPSTDRPSYERSIRTIQQLIAAGDTYQVNYTFRLDGSFEGDDLALYRDLCEAQRSGYCAYLRTGHGTIVSASPELFFRLAGGEIELRPMKGTRPRGRWTEEDDELAAALACSAKDRAENLMIVDLIRNDVGRVAEFGSVHVPELYRVERYPTVHQLTSTVRATLRKGTTITDVFRATFPSGSVTGAPKIRTSEIIAELEDSPRGVYTGAIGFVSGEEAVFSVAIRTVRLDAGGRRARVGIGSGITADSDPGDEYHESIGKHAFLRRRMPRFQLLESLRLEPDGSFPLLELHIVRLMASARYFDFPVDPDEVRHRLERGAAELTPGIYKVRLLVGRDGTYELQAEPIPESLPPARLRLADTPVDETDVFLYHKTTHRPPNAGIHAIPPGIDDLILRNRRDELTETTRANLVLDLDGKLVTPPVESGLLRGVMREKLLREGAIETRVLRPADLQRAGKIYLINAVRGWREGFLEEPLPNLGSPTK